MSFITKNSHSTDVKDNPEMMKKQKQTERQYYSSFKYSTPQNNLYYQEQDYERNFIPKSSTHSNQYGIRTSEGQLFMSSIPHYVPELNSKQIMETIWSTEQKIRKTKQYVDSIPIKSQFYSPSFQTQPLKYQQQQTAYPKNRVQTSKNPLRINKISDQRKEQTKFHKSPTPIQKLHDIQNDQMNIVQEEYASKELYNSFQSKPLSQIKQSQENNLNSEGSNQFQFQTFRSKQLHSQNGKYYEVQSDYLASKQYTNLNKQNNYFRNEMHKLDNQLQLSMQMSTQQKTPKAYHQKQLNAYVLSTNIKSPLINLNTLNKTFQAYSNYSSNPSSGRSYNTQKKSNQSSQAKKKQGLEIIKADQVIRYFKKKPKVHSHISSLNSNSKSHSKQSKQQKDVEKYTMKSPEKLSKYQSGSKANYINIHQSEDNQPFSLNNVEKVQSNLVTPLQKSPRTFFNHQTQNQAQVLMKNARQSTPINRINNHNNNKIQINIYRQTSNKKNPKKQLFLKQGVYPFENLQNDSQKKQKYKSPSHQGQVLRSISPLTPQNIKTKTNMNSFQKSDKRSKIQEVNSRYVQRRQDSPQLQQYYSIQMNTNNHKWSSPIDLNKSVQNPATPSSKHGSGRRKHGITVLLKNNSPQQMKIKQIKVEAPLTELNELTQNKKPNFIQISLQNSFLQNSFEQNEARSIQRVEKVEISNKKNYKIAQSNKKNLIKNKVNNSMSIAQKINQSITKLQKLNKVDNQIHMRESTKSRQKNQRQQLKKSRKFSRTSSDAKKIRKPSSNFTDQKQSKEREQQLNDEGNKQKQISKMRLGQKFIKKQKVSSEQHIKNAKPSEIQSIKLHINQLNSLIIYPQSSSLQKYQNSFQNDSFNQTIGDFSKTVSNTPQKKLNDFVPKSHIIRLEKQMEALNQQSNKKISKSNNRRKIFDSLDKSYDSKQQRIQKNNKPMKERINRLYQRDIQAQNKSLQGKLYKFLVEEDVEAKRPSNQKYKFSPLKKNLNGMRIFQTQVKKKNASSKNKPSSTKFNYNTTTQRQRNNLYNSLQNFEQSIKKQNLNKNSHQKGLDSQRKNAIQSFQPHQKKLNQAQIRKQIQRIKEYDFIERYITNFELEQMMRKYIHKYIPPRKWTLLIIDQVYKRIREKQEVKK